MDFSEAMKTELTKKAVKKGRHQLQVLNRAKGVALKVHYELAEQEALKEMKLYRNLPLFTTALGVYLGNGDKNTKNLVRLTSTDPSVLLVWLQFLLQLCGVSKDKISLALFIYPDLDEVKCRRYWSRKLGVKKFHTTQVLAERSDVSKKSYGSCSIVLTDTYLKKKIQVWIDHLPEMVLNTVPKK